jgi:hypothetical protein
MTAGNSSEVAMQNITGGCLCGALRYAASGEPTLAGYCCCNDCRKASGSGFIGFMGFPASAVLFTGESQAHTLKQADGRLSQRNFCPNCGGLVFGGVAGISKAYTVYAGSLDHPSRFHPTIAIFTRDKPDWVVLPAGITLFERMPG